MSLYKFKRGDLLLNTFVAHPEYNFFIYNKRRYINSKNVISGAYSSSVTNVPPGVINLYELNVNRDILKHTYDTEKRSASGTGTGNKEFIFPWIYAQESTKLKLSTLTNGQQKTRASKNPPYEITGSYPLSSSISYYHFAGSDTTVKHRLESLRNTINYYKHISPHYTYSGSVPEYNSNNWRIRNLNDEDVSLISIPSIIHGGGLKKGSVSLKFYVSGVLQAELTDVNQRGELVQASGTISSNDGRVAGFVLYNEGAIVLTGSWDLNNIHQEDYLGGGNVKPKWIYFGSTLINEGTSVTTISSSYKLDFQATERIPNLTMMAHANRGELNFSNNPSFISASKNNLPLTGTTGYYENTNRAITNIVSSSYLQSTGSFEKITYVRKIAIYDKYKNIIGIANLANPVRKREQDSYTFKMKLDM